MKLVRVFPLLLALCLALTFGGAGCGDIPDEGEVNVTTHNVEDRTGLPPFMSNNWCIEYQNNRCVRWQAAQLPSQGPVTACDSSPGGVPRVLFYGGSHFGGTCRQITLASWQATWSADDLSLHGWYNTGRVMHTPWSWTDHTHRVRSMKVFGGWVVLYGAPLLSPYLGGFDRWNYSGFSPNLANSGTYPDVYATNGNNWAQAASFHRY